MSIPIPIMRRRMSIHLTRVGVGRRWEAEVLDWGMMDWML